MGRLRGVMWLMAGLVVAALAGVVGFVTLAKAAAPANNRQAAGPKASVVVAARMISARTALSAADVQLKSVPADAAPEGTLYRAEEAVGRLVLTDIYPGEMILMQRLVDPNVKPANGRMALVLAEDQVLMAFPAQDLMSKIGMLRAGDHVDLLFSFEFPASISGDKTKANIALTGQGKDQATFSLLQNVTVSAIVGGKPATTTTASESKLTSAGRLDTRGPEALLLTLSPQDALILKYMKDAGGVPDIVLRAPGVEQPSEAEPVDAEYIKNRYRIAGE